MSEPLDTVSTSEEKERAAAQGWREEPRDNFKTAREFLEIGEKIQPIMKERQNHLSQQIEALHRENQMMKEAFFKSQHEAKMEGYKRAKAELLEKQAAAFEAADEAAYKRSTAALEKLEPPVAPVIPAATVPKVDASFTEWQTNNTWYGSDRVMSAAADAIGEELAKTTSLVGAPFYKEVERRVREEFPHKFGNQNRNSPNTVETGGTTSQKTNKKDFASLPADIKSGADYAMRAFGYKTKEDFAKAYWREADKNGW